MALFQPIKRAKADILNTPIKEGQFLTATDTGEMWLDVSNSERIQLAIPVNDIINGGSF